jgi:hypothetical protein
VYRDTDLWSTTEQVSNIPGRLCFACHSILKYGNVLNVRLSQIPLEMTDVQHCISQHPSYLISTASIARMGLQTLLHRRSRSVMTMKSAWTRRESSISHVNLTGDRNWTLISAMLETILRHANASWAP